MKKLVHGKKLVMMMTPCIYLMEIAGRKQRN